MNDDENLDEVIADLADGDSNSSGLIKTGSSADNAALSLA